MLQKWLHFINKNRKCSFSCQLYVLIKQLVKFGVTFVIDVRPHGIDVDHVTWNVKEILDAFNYISLTALLIIYSEQMKPEKQIIQAERTGERGKKELFF